ncbi:Air1p [Apiospora rasikravindrae]|uniref:Air1p n=1 Tax=Apiospora rasikravindrae TaxID=990691 RepID=A0ABR1S2D2_9PEZI
MAGESDSSPGGQKRPRDYGEELKGLTPERHSDRDGSSTPTRKKQRTDQSPVPDISGPSGDAEVNGLSAQHVAPPSAIAAEPGSAPAPSDVLDPLPDNEASQKEDQETSNSQGLQGINRGVRLLGVRTSFGKSKGASATPPTQTPIIKPAAPPVPSHEDPTKSGSDNEYSEGEVEEDDESGDEEDGEDMPATTPGASSDDKPTDANETNTQTGYATIKVSKKDWKLPKGDIRIIKWSSGAQTKATWWIEWLEKELDYLIALLMRSNPDKPAVGRKVVSGALEYILHHRNGFFVGASRSKNKVAKAEAKRAVLGCDNALWNDALAKARIRVANEDYSAPNETQIQLPVAKTAEAAAETTADVTDLGNDEGAVASVAGAFMSEDEEVRQLELYFPRIGEIQVVCLHCVSTQHRSESCPSLTCGFCQSAAHMSYACPTKKRCTKCYQLGHGAGSCQEKLALAKDERPGCAYCSARSHIEDRCPTVWRSYHPGLTEIKKVKDIPCYCYMCGTAGHYGPECGLASKKQKAEAQVFTTWSKANRDSYIDPESTNIAIAQVGVDHSNADGASEFHIKGKATKKTHIHFVSSDDSEGEFIQPPVSRGGPGKGGISISTNIVNPSQQQSGRPSRRSRNNGQPPPPGNADMPPLPPGPPPPMVFTGNGNGISNGSQRSFHPLPPRPSGMNSNGGGGGGGSGGGGGRGGGNRGRGRGRGRTGNRGGGGR